VSECRFSEVCNLIGLMVILMGTALVPARGQQEVDPTWYNPWPAAKTDVPNASRLQVSNKQKPKVSPVPAGQPSPGKRRKRSVAQRGRASMRLPSR
jgi:hypothetical protein